MSDDVKQALIEQGLMNDYRARPDYQRNDYLGWIARAKQEQTRQKRIDQMLGELRQGGVYMNMTHLPSAKGPVDRDRRR